MVYEWKIPKYTVEAQRAGEELERIEGKYGAVRAGDVVRESSAQAAVLHPLFEWNDTTAARKYRLRQAQEIIQNLVTVVRVLPNEPPKSIRTFVSIEPTPQEKSAYITVATVLSNEEYTAQMLQNALEELAAFRQKYANLRELTDVIRAIDALQ